VDILLTFAGNRDPFNPEAVQGGYTYGNREAAAKLLGIQPHTFRKRAKEKFGL